MGGLNTPRRCANSSGCQLTEDCTLLLAKSNSTVSVCTAPAISLISSNFVVHRIACVWSPLLDRGDTFIRSMSHGLMLNIATKYSKGKAHRGDIRCIARCVERGRGGGGREREREETDIRGCQACVCLES